MSTSTNIVKWKTENQPKMSQNIKIESEKYETEKGRRTYILVNEDHLKVFFVVGKDTPFMFKSNFHLL